MIIIKIKICTKYAVDHKLTKGIIFTMEFPLAAEKKALFHCDECNFKTKYRNNLKS
jgi:hypothetical protein